MDRHCANAAAVADMLAGPPRGRAGSSTRGWPSHPGHAVAARQMRGFGGMVSFVLRGGEAAALEVARSTTVCGPWPSRSGRSSRSSSIPHRMTHASVAGSPLEVDPGLVRLSVGLETAADLIADLAAPAARARVG